MNEEMVTETDIGDLYEQSLIHREAQQRTKLLAGLKKDLNSLGITYGHEHYLKKISQSRFKVKMLEELDNKQLMNLRIMFAKRIAKKKQS